jgi:superfamily I DNA and RNA helicase
MLRLICAYYDLPFLSLREAGDFNQACKLTIKELKSRGIANTRHMVDYVFIDESQDFEDSFIELCSMVTNKRVYVAGDIFQSIFEEHIVDAHNTDFLLSRCYRTDPKTLMFAQGLGMGLFESKKLYWLEKEKWELCGYSVVENTQQNIYTLSREPIRRFEDLSPNYVSLDIKETNDLCSTVIATLNELKNENPSIQPSDVCIIFLDTENYVYEYASKLGFIIEDKIGWDYILAHETKDITSERLVITNRNNIKGLEFPFVFCITKKIIRDHNYRNTIYTMLSRSFLRSYLIVQKDDDNGLTEEMKKGAENILKNKNMVVKIPTKEEIKEIKQDFGIQHQSKSLRERIETLMRKYDIPIDKIDYVVENVQTLPNKAPNDDQLEKLISALKGLV